MRKPWRKEPEFHSAEGHGGDSQRGRRRNEDQFLLDGEPVRILGKTSNEGFGEETLGTQTIQTAQKQRLRKAQKTVMITQVRDRDHSDALFQLETDVR